MAWGDSEGAQTGVELVGFPQTIKTLQCSGVDELCEGLCGVFWGGAFRLFIFQNKTH